MLATLDTFNTRGAVQGVRHEPAGQQQQRRRALRHGRAQRTAAGTPTKTISIESIPNQVRQRFLKGMCNVFGSQGVMEGIRQYKAYGVPASQLVIGLPWYGYGMPRDLLPTE